MRRVQLFAVALISFLTVTAGSFLHRAVAVSLCGVLGINSAACYLNSHNLTLAAQPSTTVIAQQTQLSAGRFQIAYGPVKSEFYQKYQRGLQQSGGFEVLAEELNQLNLDLPVNVPIIFTECGKKNAFYINKEHSIVICNELTVAFAELFYADSPKTPINQIFYRAGQVTLFIILHEVGHALIHLLDLPSTGREEDAVDELAAVLLLTNENNLSEEAVLNTAVSFLLQGQQNIKKENIPFWDEHSLDMQRFYSLTCLLYGKNPAKYSRLVQRKILPEARAARCENEYAQKHNSWVRLLAPHIKAASQPRESITPQPFYPKPNSGASEPEPLW